MSTDSAADAAATTTRRKRGTLRVYLGAAPGVGKTYAMLGEGRRALERGTDVVVGFVETHGRARTAEQLTGLEIIPRKQLTYRDTTFEEMDVDAILARRPERALIDELAHTNVPGSRNAKRWEDVEELLAAGIDVISTVNIQHLESLNDVVERITGIHQRETVPDDVVRAADQVELVDMSPEAIRRRLAHGNIYAPEKVDTALTNYFRPGNLAALRELALLWVADKVDLGLEAYRSQHGITAPWETRERVVVALTGAPGTEALIRRAARIAQRTHGELVGVHVTSEDGLASPPIKLVEQHRKLLEDLGGEFHEVTGTNIANALVDFAHAENATQLILGASQRSRADELVRGSVVNRVVRLSGPIDVHIISHDPDEQPPARPSRLRRVWRRAISPAIAPRRRLAGWVLALGGVPALTLLLAQLRDQAGLPTVLLAFLTLVVTTAAVGGTLPAVVAAAGASMAANWFFTPPYYRWTIAEGDNVVALFVFVGIALVVSGFVNIAALRTTEAARARNQASTLARLAATTAEQDPLPSLLEHLRAAFAQDATAVLRRRDGQWSVDVAAGEPVPRQPDQATTVEDLGPDAVLALNGPRIAAEDHLVLNAFAAQLAVVLEHTRLRGEADRARSLAEANALRTALLQAVSHDLRTPLAAIKVSASSLSQHDVHWSDQETADFVQTINQETDRLNALVGNLLDMSRVQAGALQPTLRAVALEEVVPAAILSLNHPADCVHVDLPETLPTVLADPALLERALANVIDNAVHFSPPGHPVRITSGTLAGHVELRIIDQGPGIPRADRERVFQPFQRLGDSPTDNGGVGLGLAVAHGFLTAMGATIEIDDTPAGGTTMTISLPAAEEPAQTP